jgi:carbonic anhydrase
MDIKKVFENNRNWAEARKRVNPSFFRNLSLSQQPNMLYIGCSDSRVTAEELMGANPGDVFVYRNIANLVPAGDLASMAIINYAVTVLRVEHIVVCGHYHCGGIEAALQPKDMGILNPWLRNIRDIYRHHRHEIETSNSIADRQKRLVELNVREQCVNVIKAPEVQKAIRSKTLNVHGWVFDMETGLLKDLKVDTDAILQEIMSIYRLE